MRYYLAWLNSTKVSDINSETSIRGKAEKVISYGEFVDRFSVYGIIYRGWKTPYEAWMIAQRLNHITDDLPGEDDIAYDFEDDGEWKVIGITKPEKGKYLIKVDYYVTDESGKEIRHTGYLDFFSQYHRHPYSTEGLSLGDMQTQLDHLCANHDEVVTAIRQQHSGARIERGSYMDLCRVDPKVYIIEGGEPTA